MPITFNKNQNPIFDSKSQKQMFNKIIGMLALVAMPIFVLQTINDSTKDPEEVVTPIDLCQYTPRQAREAGLVLPKNCPQIQATTSEYLDFDPDALPPIMRDTPDGERFSVTNPEPEPEQTSASGQTQSNWLDNQFPLNGGGSKSGRQIVEYVRADGNGAKIWNAFNSEFGENVANQSAITLFYENGTLWPYTTGVCSAKHWIDGDYRNCNFADINSAGFDAGMLQVNSHYQAPRIASLGGPNCQPSNSRDRSDACNQQRIAWLHNVDNNIKISLSIYREQGFRPWYGFLRVAHLIG